MLREWLLSRQCQFTAQAVVGILVASVFTVAQPIHFRNACLSPVFVVIIIAALAQDQHVGTRIQVTALLLGPAWLAVLLAVITMTLAKLAERPEQPWNPGFVAAACLLGLAGLAVLILVRAAAPPGPARVMGILAAVIYGIIVLLSIAATSIQGFLLNAVAYVVLSMVLAAAVCLAVGLWVAPSLATDEVIRLTAETLQGGLVAFDADAWAALLEDAELLLVRASTLEALSDERRLQGLQLHHLQHYRNIADAMAMTLAQLAAFLAHVANLQDGVSWSAVLSGLERQGSGVSSYLWERKGGWETGRQLLLREIESSVGSYWWAVRRATKAAPVQVPRSREVMTLTFIWPITNGLLDALERIEGSAQRVLSAQHKPHHQQQQQRQQQPQQRSSVRRWLASVQAWRRERQQWLQPLLALLVIRPGLQVVKQALFKDLPHALSSKQAFRGMLASRSFQAGAKLLLASGSVLVLTILLMVYDVRVRSLAPIFGFTSVCLSMQERVEATTDKVVWRVLGTIVGACLGLGITHIPSIFSQPVLLLACLAAACVPLSMLATAQTRTGVALAVLTLLAVALCSYELACCVPGAHLMNAMTVFAARLGSVVGACIYVALLNRLLLPWYTSDYALEQMADALEQAAALFEKIYISQHNRMRVAALAAGGSAAAGADLALTTSANDCEAAAAATARGASSGVLDSAAAAAELAALEAAEAALHVALRQQVLQRLVAVQMALAKDTVSWRRGVLATPQIVLDVLGAMIELVEALACQRLALAPFTRQGGSAASGAGAAAAGEAAAPSGLLRVSGHCYSVWAQPLHPVWLQVLTALSCLPASARFWPIDSVHFFTFTYGASRVLNKLAGVSQALLAASR
ncbi:hypothetical protein OEZ86_000195 [Tetradesmus obliquus]|nr:hypothetical protein OEZ86_000195 [Tetradesmus obliquus]